MKWSDIGETIGKYAPMVGTLIAGPAGGTLGSLVAATLGTENTPEAVMKMLKDEPDRAGPLLQQMQEENKHQYKMMLLEMQKTQIVEQAKTARAELSTGDKFVMYWRPSFGYALCLSFVIFTSALAYVLYKAVQNPAEASLMLTAVSQVVGAVTVIWGTALAVLGINVHSRSKDKAIEAGHTSSGLLSGLMSKLGK